MTRTKLIAELCQNHQGSRETLGEMIAAAAESGADYVKMQSVFADDLTFRERFEEGVVGGDGQVRTIRRPYGPERERLAGLELTGDDHLYFIETCAAHGVVPLTTVFARRRIPFVAGLPWPERVVKVASYDCASLPLLRELCEHFDHLIVATGATYDHEIEAAARTVKEAGRRLTLLHCVTSYPNTLDMCHLARVGWLRRFTDSVGWSDHTLVERDGVKAAMAAIALGAGWIERHFTILDRTRTKDGPVSIGPAHLRELRAFADLPESDRARAAREAVPGWDAIVGSETREMTPEEHRNRDYYRGRFASETGGTWTYNWDEAVVSRS